MMYKKRSRQSGWFSLQEKKKGKRGKKLLVVSSTTCLEDAEEAERGSSQRCDVTRQKATNTCSCVGNTSQICERRFHLVGGQSGPGTRVLWSLRLWRH